MQVVVQFMEEILICHFLRIKVLTSVSLYAATKKSNELMAHAYSHLDIPATGLRFFTVYGPWAGQIWLFSYLLNRY